MLRLFEVNSSRGDLSDADVQLAKIVIRFIILWLKLQRFFELAFRRLQFSQPHKVDGKIHARAGRVRLQAHSLLQVRRRLGVLRLRGVDQAKKFLNLEAFGNLAQQRFQRHGSFWKPPGLVISHRSLELAVQALARASSGTLRLHPGRKSEKCETQQAESWNHDSGILASRAELAEPSA